MSTNLNMYRRSKVKDILMKKTSTGYSKFVVASSGLSSTRISQKVGNVEFNKKLSDIQTEKF